MLFFAIAVAGLAYVKWLPYWDRAFVAASSHSIGQSILMGKAAQAPAASWDAALAYALAYGKAIWKAMALGLLLGSGAQACCPPTGCVGCSERRRSAARSQAACSPCQG